MKALLYILPGPPKKLDEHGPHRFGKLVQYLEYSKNVMEKVIEVAKQYKTGFHPFVVIATTNNLPVKYYLSVFDAIYTFETFLGALDVMFQSFFVFNNPYPSEVNSFYIFLQRFFYGIMVPKQRSPASVNSLINELDYTRL